MISTQNKPAEKAEGAAEKPIAYLTSTYVRGRYHIVSQDDRLLRLSVSVAEAGEWCRRNGYILT